MVCIGVRCSVVWCLFVLMLILFFVLLLDLKLI